MALLKEFSLEVGEDGQAGLEGKYFAVKDHIIPDTASNLKVNVFDKDGDEPVGEEEGGVDLEGLEVRMQLGQYLSKIAVEQVDP